MGNAFSKMLIIGGFTSILIIDGISGKRISPFNDLSEKDKKEVERMFIDSNGDFMKVFDVRKPTYISRDQSRHILAHNADDPRCSSESSIQLDRIAFSEESLARMCCPAWYDQDHDSGSRKYLCRITDNCLLTSARTDIYIGETTAIRLERTADIVGRPFMHHGLAERCCKQIGQTVVLHQYDPAGDAQYRCKRPQTSTELTTSPQSPVSSASNGQVSECGNGKTKVPMFIHNGKEIMEFSICAPIEINLPSQDIIKQCENPQTPTPDTYKDFIHKTWQLQELRYGLLTHPKDLQRTQAVIIIMVKKRFELIANEKGAFKPEWMNIDSPEMIHYYAFASICQMACMKSITRPLEPQAEALLEHADAWFRSILNEKGEVKPETKKEDAAIMAEFYQQMQYFVYGLENRYPDVVDMAVRIRKLAEYGYSDNYVLKVRVIGKSLAWACQAIREQKKFLEALGCTDYAIEYNQIHGFLWGLSMARNNYGVTYGKMSGTKEQKDFYLQLKQMSDSLVKEMRGLIHESLGLASTWCNKGKSHRQLNRFFRAFHLYEAGLGYRQYADDAWGVGGAQNQMATVIIFLVNHFKDKLDPNTKSILLSFAIELNKSALPYYHQKNAKLGYAEVSEFLAALFFLNGQPDIAKLFLAENFWWRQEGAVGDAFEKELLPFLKEAGLIDKQDYPDKDLSAQIRAQCFAKGVVDKNAQYDPPVKTNTAQTERVYKNLETLVHQQFDSFQCADKQQIDRLQQLKNQCWDNKDINRLVDVYFEIGSFFATKSYEARTKPQDSKLFGMFALHHFRYILYGIPMTNQQMQQKLGSGLLVGLKQELGKLPEYFNLQPSLSSLKNPQEVIDSAVNKYLDEDEKLEGIDMKTWKNMEYNGLLKTANM